MGDVKRSVCLCNGEFIGIESIYTVIGGKQINKEKELKELRIKSRCNHLFCPCGCGLNLVLVASDNNLVSQHFRLKKGQDASKCHMKDESDVSIDSKIVLKCWLDDKLNDEGLMARVPVCQVGDSERRFEFTYLSKTYGVAINYCHERMNLLEEKLMALENNGAGLKIIHIVDQLNEETYGQFPENMKKIQDKQGYCLFLNVAGRDYLKAEMSASFYVRNIEGLWERVTFVAGALNDYDIFPEGELAYRGRTVKDLFAEAVQKHQKAIEARRCEQEERKRQLEESTKEEERKRQEELLQIQEDEKITVYCDERSGEFYTKLLSMIKTNDKIFKDEKGRRWCQCVKCGLIETETRFAIMGSPYGYMQGICKKCYKKFSK